MGEKDFQQHTPAFSGVRMRMNTRRVHCEDSFSTVAITHEAGGIEVCRFYLPYGQGKALEKAVSAFNAIMDQDEAAAKPLASQVEAA